MHKNRRYRKPEFDIVDQEFFVKNLLVISRVFMNSKAILSLVPTCRRHSINIHRIRITDAKLSAFEGVIQHRLHPPVSTTHFP